MQKGFTGHDNKDLTSLHVIVRQTILIVLSYNYIS